MNCTILLMMANAMYAQLLIINLTAKKIRRNDWSNLVEQLNSQTEESSLHLLPSRNRLRRQTFCTVLRMITFISSMKLVSRGRSY